MNDLNIPLYRAKKIDSDEYVIGYYCGNDNLGHNIADIENGMYINIDISTLAIHFLDMIASDSDRLLQKQKKDLRIFASLNKEGKGGDKIEFYRNGKYVNGITYYENKFINYDGFGISPHIEETLKVIGIQK